MGRDEKSIKVEITKILIELGIPINLQGFKYFRECVYKVIKEPLVMKKVTKCLYPQVGDIFDVKGTVVERCMRHAADLGYYKTGFKSINKYFGISCLDGWNYKPTNSELVALIAEFLRMNLDEQISKID